MEEKPQFVSSFDMKSEHVYKGRAYYVRLGASRHITSAPYLPHVITCIGTVMHKDSEYFHEHPLAEAVQAFRDLYLGVPLVGARLTPTYETEYDGGVQPATHQDEHTVFMTAWADAITAKLAR